MRKVEALVLLSTLSTSILAAESTRPRGVGPEFAKFYKNAETFTCISTPSIILSPSQINDDYCDCPDGSDEPGTAACTYLSELSPPQPIAGKPNTSLALPGFYCKNKGHIPTYVSHTYVNDGVCDYDLCCDGSDEWAGAGGVKCADKCAEIGKEWKRLDDIKQKSHANARKKNVELVKEAQTLRAGVEMSIGRLELEISTLESKAADLKKKYDEVERKERGKVVKTGGAKTSKVSILAALAKARVEELRKSLVSVVGRRNLLKEKVTQLEAILAQFKEEYNPNFNDEGVKRAVKSWEDYAASKEAEGESDYSAAERDIEEMSKPDSETEGINWAEWETEEEDISDVDTLYRFEEYFPDSVRDWMHQKLSELRAMLVENGILAANANAASGTESKLVTNARSAYEAADKDVSTKSTDLNNLKSDLEKDYGPSDVFRALKGTCVSKDSGEYDYELCWMDKTSQKSKKGHGNTGMGNFVRFDTMEVDEEVGTDGKGVGKGERIVMKYENGQHCWNGPNRQTTVVLACAEKDEIWKVMEQEKCMYRMDVGTSAVCEKEGKVSRVKKDEL